MSDSSLSTSASWVLRLLIFSAGVSFSLVGSMLPEIARTFSLDNNQAGTIPFILFAGDFTGLLLAGVFLRRSSVLLVVAAFVLCAAGFLVGALSSYSWVYILAFYVYGLSRVMLISLPGIIVSRTTSGPSAGPLNVIYAFFAAGVMLAPITSGALVKAGFHYSIAFFGLSLLAGVSGLAALFARLPSPELGRGLRPSAVSELFRDHRRIFLVAVVMNLCYIGAENVPNSWVPKYLESAFGGGTELRSSFILTLFWAAMTAGRFGVAGIVKKGAPPRATLAFLAGASALCLLFAPYVESRLACEALFIGSGLFFSGIFPIIISFTERLPERTSSTMFILVMAAGAMGAAGAGKGVGVIADAMSFPAGMVVAALLSGVVLLLVPLARPEAVKKRG
ncbi:MAG: MFS transporter [bacterium]